VTVFQSVAGIGAGLLAPRLMNRFGRVRLVAGGLVLLGIGIVPLMFTVIPIAILGMGIVGFGVTAAVVAFITERQVATPPELQGRTSTASHLVLNFPQVVVTLAGAAVLTVVDYRILLGLTAIACLVSGFASFRLRSQPAEEDVPSLS
jgi:MFS family permease